MQRCLIGSWLLTAGTNGGGADNACGLDCSVRAWNVDVRDRVVVKESGTPVVIVWEVVRLDGKGRVVVALERGGRPVLEIWDVGLGGDGDGVLDGG